MKIKNEFRKTCKSIGLVLSRRKYMIISLIFSLLLFSLSYYFFVAKVAYHSIWISVNMSGPLFVTLSITFILITSILSGILFSMLLFKFEKYHKTNKKGFFGFVGYGIGAFGTGCPTCGAFLFGLVGLPFALASLPFKGIELHILGIFILSSSIYLTEKSINEICKLKGDDKNAS